MGRLVEANTKMGALTSELDTLEKKAAAIVAEAATAEGKSSSNKTQLTNTIASLVAEFPPEMQTKILATALATLAMSFSGIAPHSPSSTGKKKKDGKNSLYGNMRKSSASPWIDDDDDDDGYNSRFSL